MKPLEDLPYIFLVLNGNGEKFRLKLEGLAHLFFSSVLSGKIRLSGLPNQAVQFA
jgi:hypothetical protein